MSPAEQPIERLADSAREIRVVVVGGGIAGLVAALECAKVGLSVTLVDASDAVGGVIREREVDDVVVPVGPDGYSTAGGHLPTLVDELGLADAVRAETALAPWVSGVPAGPAPLPTDAVLGIPSNPWDPSVRRIIGWGGVWRAYLDRLRPPLTIGQQTNLDKLVRGRMGDLVADRLVAPLSVGAHGLRPAEVDVELAAPGLSTALTRTGSLSGAVAQLRGARSGAARYESLEGGPSRLVAVLSERLVDYAVDVRTDARVTQLDRVGAGAGPDAWRVRGTTRDKEFAATADVVIVAASEIEARRLLAPHLPLPETPPPAGTLDVVTLVIDGAVPARAVYPVPGSTLVRSVVAVSARWPWLAERVGAHRSVVRVTLVDAPADEGEAIDAARDAASAAFGTDDLSVRDARVDRLPTAHPRSAQGAGAAADRVRAAAAALPGLAVVGAWVAGSGLAQVIPDAAAAADRVRRAALFGQ